MKVKVETILNLMVFVAIVTTVLSLIRFYPDLRRYLQMKSM